MIKRFFIYEMLGWPDGPLALLTVKVPQMDTAYYVDSIRGYSTLEEAEKQLEDQMRDEKLNGKYIILKVYSTEKK